MKKQSLIGIIGGSGLYSMKAFRLKRKISLKTPYGKPSGSFMVGTLGNTPAVFLPRHGVGHVINPSELNFRANIWGMKKLGVEAIFSISAVGSLRKKIKPGHMVVIDQFIDRTKSRASTFFEGGIVGHVAFAEPICSRLRKILVSSAKKAKATVHSKGTYVCMEGPMFSTKAESHWYRQMKADVIGMTNLQEAKLAREAGICYATLALSTDYDCWKDDDHVSTEEILKVLHNNVEMAQKILMNVASAYKASDCSCHHAAANSILTDPKKISAAVKRKLDLIAGKYL